MALIVLAVLAVAIAAMFLIGGPGGHGPSQHAATAGALSLIGGDRA